MGIKEIIDQLEKEAIRYKYLIGILIIILLISLLFATFKNFEKQNEIIETGGFIDGKIKCVCNQEAWENHQGFINNPLNLTVSKNNNGE